MAGWSLRWVVVLVSLTTPCCSGSTSDESGAAAGGSTGSDASDHALEECVDSYFGPDTASECKTCLATRCAQPSLSYCNDPTYPAAQACYAGCPQCSTNCESAYNECSLSCGAGDAPCCGACGEERKTCHSGCESPACDCVPLDSSLFGAAASLATCLALSCVSECAGEIGPC